jgi:hypothetical protein
MKFMTYVNFYYCFQAQARECLFEKLELQSRERRDVDVCLDLAQEAAQVSVAKCILTSDKD